MRADDSSVSKPGGLDTAQTPTRPTRRLSSGLREDDWHEGRQRQRIETRSLDTCACAQGRCTAQAGFDTPPAAAATQPTPTRPAEAVHELVTRGRLRYNAAS